MSSSSDTAFPPTVTRQPTLALVSPAIVPHPQACPLFVADNTVASAVQFANEDICCGGVGATVVVGVMVVAEDGLLPPQPASNVSERRIEGTT